MATLDTVTILDPEMGSVSIVSNQLRYTKDAAFSGVAKGKYTATGTGGSYEGKWAIPVTKTGARAVGSTFVAIAQGSGFQDLDVLENDVES